MRGNTDGRIDLVNAYTDELRLLARWRDVVTSEIYEAIWSAVRPKWPVMWPRVVNSVLAYLCLPALWSRLQCAVLLLMNYCRVYTARCPLTSVRSAGRPPRGAARSTTAVHAEVMRIVLTWSTEHPVWQGHGRRGKGTCRESDDCRVGVRKWSYYGPSI